MKLPEETELESFLQAAQRRSFGLQKMRLRSQTMAYAGLLSSGVVFVGLLLGGEPLILSLVVGGVYLGFALGYLVQKKEPSLFEVAQDLDTRLELKDKLSTALCFSDPHILQEAIKLSRSIELKKALPEEAIVSPAGTSGGSAALLLASVVLLMTSPSINTNQTMNAPSKKIRNPSGTALTWEAQHAPVKPLVRSPAAKLMTRSDGDAQKARLATTAPKVVYRIEYQDLVEVGSALDSPLIEPPVILPPVLPEPITCTNPVGENTSGPTIANGSQEPSGKPGRGGDTVKPESKGAQKEILITKDVNGGTGKESSKSKLAAGEALIDNEAAREAAGEQSFDPIRVLEESLLNEDISMERREYIKQYFLLIRGEEEP